MSALPALAAALTLAAGAADARTVVSSLTHRPEHLGQCFATQVKRVETRLQDGDQPVPDSGSAIEFADGHYNVSYQTVPAIQASRPGDPVRLCVIDLPSDCPPDDTRGLTYHVRDLRTHRDWRAMDSEHMCGGA